MGLSIWSEEGNVQDLSFWFLPPKGQETASQASDTPAYLDESTYSKARQSPREPMTATPTPINFFFVFLVVGGLFALGVIKL